jgi:hypothetical protein
MHRAMMLFSLVLIRLVPAPAASAQSTEYKLTDQGEWLKTRIPTPGSDEAIISDARAALAEDRPERAREILTEFLDAGEKSASPFLAAAYRLRGDAKLAMDEEWNSVFDYEVVCQRYPQSEEFQTACEREYEIGMRYLNGLDRRLFGVRLLPAIDDGVELLIRVQERLPGSALAEKAAISLADFYFRNRDMALAAESYDLYLANFPRGPHALQAQSGRILANLAQFKSPAYDATPLVDAREQARRFQRDYPAEAERQGFDAPLLARIDETLALQLLDNARWRLDRGELASARYTLRRLVRSYPQSASGATALAILQERGWLPEPAPAPAEQPQPPPEKADEGGGAPAPSPEKSS